MRLILLSISLNCLLAVALSAQDRVAINGSVKDASNAVIPGADVELISSEMGFHRSTVSGAKGLFEITALPVGSYTVTITAPGFKPTTIRNVDLQYGETRTVD